MAIVPPACQPFTVEFFRRLRELDDAEEKLEALAEFERRYGHSRGIDILRADLRGRTGSLEVELKDRLGGIAECTRREVGEIDLEDM